MTKFYTSFSDYMNESLQKGSFVNEKTDSANVIKRSAKTIAIFKKLAKEYDFKQVPLTKALKDNKKEIYLFNFERKDGSLIRVFHEWNGKLRVVFGTMKDQWEESIENWLDDTSWKELTEG